MTIELSQYCKTCNRSNLSRKSSKIDSKNRLICSACGAYKMKPKITREYVMENCKIISQDAIDNGLLITHSVMAIQWACERGAGIDIPYQSIVDAPEEVITKAINELVDFTVKHMTRCRLGCKYEINS